MRHVLAGLAVLCVMTAPVRAQGLRDQISQLFIFGPGQDPLFLAGTADPSNPATITLHGKHFTPAAAAGNGTIISFITAAIGGNVADYPFSAASGGTTFRFEGGVPVPTSVSPGPVFAERAPTLGRGRVLIGVSYNTLHYTTLRGVDLKNLQLTFTHQNVTGPACDSIVGQSCDPMGVPNLENDIMPFTLSLDVNVSLASFVMTYGLTDRIDIGVAIPVVSTTLSGSSFAQIIPFGGPTATHFFGGTPSNPVLTASRFVQGSATGLGDVAVRAKVNLRHTDQASLAVLADGRFPTGSQADLLGSGRFSGRILAVLSARAGSFSPHANLGYLIRSDSSRNDAVLATVGFDHLLSSWVTLAVDVISQLQVGDSKLTVPGPVEITKPFLRTIQTSEIPNGRDDIVNGSFGFKFTTGHGPTIITNALFPLNRGGLRPNMLWTLGAEYTF
ncbi:MAG: hypothetical protein ACHQU1_04250 [Gemmatimonadales bacterium]